MFTSLLVASVFGIGCTHAVVVQARNDGVSLNTLALLARSGCSPQICNKNGAMIPLGTSPMSRFTTTEANCLATCTATSGCQSVTYQLKSGARNSGSDSGDCSLYKACVSTLHSPSTQNLIFYDRDCPAIHPTLPAACSTQVCDKIGQVKPGMNSIKTLVAIPADFCIQSCQTEALCNSVSYNLHSGTIGTGREEGDCTMWETCVAEVAETNQTSFADHFFDKNCPAPTVPVDPSCPLPYGLCHWTGQFNPAESVYIMNTTKSNDATCHKLCVDDQKCQSSGWFQQGTSTYCFLASTCAASAFWAPGQYSMTVTDRLCA